MPVFLFYVIGGGLYIPESKKVQAPLAPRFKPPPGLRPWASKVPPTERAGSEGVIYAAFGGRVLKIDGAFAPRVLKFDSGCTAEGYGGGWRRKYIRCLSAAVVDAFKNERRHDDKTGEPPCGRSSVVWFSIPRSGIIKLIAPKGETTHYDWCVALLLPIMFAVHPKGDTTTLRSAGPVKLQNLKNLRPFGPANPHAHQGVSKGDTTIILGPKGRRPLLHNPPLQAITFGPKGREPSPLTRAASRRRTLSFPKNRAEI